MLGLPQSMENRIALREKISDFLIERSEEYWMHDLLVSCQEIKQESVNVHRSRGFIDLTASELVAGHAAEPIKAEGEVESPSAIEEVLRALEWSTQLHDLGIMESLRKSLPAPILKEQVLRYRVHLEQPAHITAVAEKCLVAIDPCSTLGMRNTVALRFDEYLRVLDIVDVSSLPRKCLDMFLEKHCKISRKYKDWMKKVKKMVRRWHNEWRTFEWQGARKTGKPIKGKVRAIRKGKRKRREGMQGKRNQCPIVRQQLFDWFMGTALKDNSAVSVKLNV